MIRLLSPITISTYLAILAWSMPVVAHPGHGEEPPPPANAAPRAEARSDLFELVAVLGEGGRAWLYLDRADSNAPIDQATIAVGIDGREVSAERTAEAVYVVADSGFADPGARNLTFTITAGEDIDLLATVLTVPAAPVVAVATPGLWASLTAAAREPVLWAAALAVLLLGALLGRFSAPRLLPAWAEEPPYQKAGTSTELGLRASGALSQAVQCPIPLPPPPTPASTASPHPAGDDAVKERPRVAASVLACLLALLPVAAAAQPVDPPRRQPDGSVFVPKPTQRLLGRAHAARPSSARPRWRCSLAGQVIADPNASGRVQASRGRPGRGAAGAVSRRLASAWSAARSWPSSCRCWRPRSAAACRPASPSSTRRSSSPSSARSRLTGLTGTVSAREIAEARAELEGLRQRRAATRPALNGRRGRRRPPASGVISVARVAAGQMVDAREPLFEIVDPDSPLGRGHRLRCRCGRRGHRRLGRDGSADRPCGSASSAAA